MIYILFIIGIIICFYGWRLIKEESKIHKDAFKEVISEQNKDNADFIKILTINTELKNQLITLEDKLNILLKDTKEIKHLSVNDKEYGKESELTKNEPESIYKEDDNYPNYNEAANKIKKMTEENKSIEEMASALSIGKGEVLLLKRLLKE
jgi:hypothetical protein